MDDVIPAGDVDVGDIIVLPGQGGLIFTAASASSVSASEEERPVKLSATVRLHKRGRDLAG